MTRIRSLSRKLQKNRKGGVEGLPLQLMIIIIIATLGTAVIVGWMGNIETPKSIGDVEVTSGDIMLTSTSGTTSYTNTGTATVHVTDQDGNPLKGATVVLSGLGIDMAGKTPYKTTDADGNASFRNLNVELHGTNIGFVTVNVSMSGYGEDSSTRIAVIA